MPRSVADVLVRHCPPTYTRRSRIRPPLLLSATRTGPESHGVSQSSWSFQFPSTWRLRQFPLSQSQLIMLRPLPYTPGRASKLKRTDPSGAAATRFSSVCAVAVLAAISSNHAPRTTHHARVFIG